MAEQTVTVGVGALSIEDVIAVARGGAKVAISDESKHEMALSRAVIDHLADDTVPHYGISTGFGALASTSIPKEQRAQLQKSLIRSHAAGAGPEVEREVVRGLLVLRLSTLCTGRTGVRPETAQGIFVDFKNVMTSSRKKPPFGIANMGKSFRNEITPGNFIFRTREFEQMEMEFFVKPGEDEAWHQYWIDARTQWYLDLGVKPENLRHYEHPKEKLAHYSKRTVDIEYKFGFQGSDWGELEGIANRTDFDLSAHAEHSGEDLSYFNQATGEKYVPYVIEPAAGLTRSLMCFLVDAYDVDEAPNTKGGVDKRTVLHLDPRLAPVKAAVLPLSKKPDLQNVAQKLAADLRQHEWMIDYDEAGAIGRRYRREDEIGTPLCVTVDFDTLDDQAVTIRERDTMQQERVSLDKVADYIAERIGEKRVTVPQMPVEMGGEAWPESVKIAEAGGLY